MNRIATKIIAITSAFLIAHCYKLQAQDIHFSQFYEVSMLRNPALTGIYNGDYRMGLMYRNQWSSISAPFQTAMASVEFKKQLGESQDFLGFGGMAFYDRTGSINLTTLSGNAAISYNKNLNSEHGTFFSIGIMAGYLQRNYDPSKMTFGNQYTSGIGYNPTNPSGESLPNPKVSQMDFGVGINYTTNTGADDKTNFAVGVAAYHLTRPENNFYGGVVGVRQEMRLNANASGNWLINDMWSAQAHANISLQGKYNEIMAGGLIGRKNAASASEDVLVFYAGMMMRLNDAIIPVVKIDYNDLSFGVSYDMNVSKLRAASNIRGGFELSIIKTGIISDPSRGFSSTVCPRR
ncbi:MAG: PorP/SprF family type IX secretion system membrane protein [Chitinophagaceae bacterium]|nr:PorP/SprF family type IX secretion system membrane protein [Chitinophagaceae bacterium]